MRSSRWLIDLLAGLLAGALVVIPLVAQAQQKAAKAKDWYVAAGSWTKSTEPQPIPPTVAPVSADELKAMLDQGQKFFLVDNRNGAEFREGHIPRAVHVYDKEMEAQKGKFPADKSLPLVFYCNGYPDCPRSLNGAKIAVEWGYRKVHLFKGGIPEWVAKGYPMER
jgi:rhodanese-related sulfurtransferase